MKTRIAGIITQRGQARCNIEERCACETTKFFSNFFRKICKFLSFMITAISDTWKFWLAARQQ